MLKDSERQQWLDRMLNGERMALARVLSSVDSAGPARDAWIKFLYPKGRNAQIWGITGPPGAGKSTLVNQLVKQLRFQNKKVAVLAVDPSSPFSGGAVLGDRIRMQDHLEDRGVFIRSLGTRGKHGGLSPSTLDSIHVLDAAGFDVILIETAGVGQTELDILRIAQTILVILVPESGDSIQVMKAGLMEIASVFAINKSDRPGADRLAQEIVTMLSLKDRTVPDWDVPVLKTEAISNVGLEELMNAAFKHQEYLHQSNRMQKLREYFIRMTLEESHLSDVRASFRAKFETSEGKEILARLLERKIDPVTAGEQLIKL